MIALKGRPPTDRLFQKPPKMALKVKIVGSDNFVFSTESARQEYRKHKKFLT